MWRWTFWQAATLAAAVAGCSVAPNATAGPSPSAVATQAPTPAPTHSVTEVPSARPSPTAAATPSPSPDALHWEQLGVVGEDDLLRGEYDELVFLVTFDSGYLLFVRSDGSYGQWINRIWLSADGRSWEDVTPLGVELTLGHSALERSVASNGSEVLLIARDEDYVGSAWMTLDGRTWRRTAPDLLSDHDWAALSVWAAPSGWQAIIYEDYERGCDNDPFTCFRTTLWESPDGVQWSRLSTIARDDFDVGAGAAAADGTILVSLPADSDNVFRSSDGGSNWEPVEVPGECQTYRAELLAPSPSAPHWLLASAGFEGNVDICMSPDLATWRHLPLPNVAKLTSVSAAVTDGGHVVTVGRDCTEGGACPPRLEQWLIDDSGSFVPLRVPDPVGRPAGAFLVASGPAGVIGLTTHGANGSVPLVVTWMLVGDE